VAPEPAVADEVAGIVIDSSAAAVSATVLEVIPLKVAVMLVEPLASTAVASPVVLRVATSGIDEFHVAVAVRSWVLESE
jgi:hypothetical protein